MAKKKNQVEGGIALPVYLCGGDAIPQDSLEKLLGECQNRCSQSASRRKEMKDNCKIFNVMDNIDDGALAIGTPDAILKAIEESKKSPLLPVIAILEEATWGQSVERLHGNRGLSLMGIFRQTHLGLTDEEDEDLDELARFQSTLVDLYRKEVRREKGEEALTKAIDWKAKVEEGHGPRFFSLCADPATQGLMDSLKSSLRSLADDKKLKTLIAERKKIASELEKGVDLRSVGKRIKISGSRLPSILLLGETGTGKSLLARWIAEALFPGQTDGFASMNISAIPSELVDSMLFGAVEGSYTGMKGGEDVPGFFLANAGKVVFLDEIGDMRSDHQTRLLTYMDSGTVRPVGYHGEPIAAPVILVAATNRPLREWVASGKDSFRGDLLHRFDHVVEIPSIRERQADRKLLISLVLQDKEVNPCGAVERISLDAINHLIKKDYPGNFRELRFTIRQAVQKASLEGNKTLCLRHCI